MKVKFHMIQIKNILKLPFQKWVNSYVSFNRYLNKTIKTVFNSEQWTLHHFQSIFKVWSCHKQGKSPGTEFSINIRLDTCALSLNVSTNKLMTNFVGREGLAVSLDFDWKGHPHKLTSPSPSHQPHTHVAIFYTRFSRLLAIVVAAATVTCRDFPLCVLRLVFFETAPPNTVRKHKEKEAEMGNLV